MADGRWRRRAKRGVAALVAAAVVVAGVLFLPPVLRAASDGYQELMRPDTYTDVVDAYYLVLTDPARTADDRARRASARLTTALGAGGVTAGLREDPVNYARVPVVLERKRGDTATLSVVGRGIVRRAAAGCEVLTGTVTLRRQGGEWRIAALPRVVAGAGARATCTRDELATSWSDQPADTGSAAFPERSRVQRVDTDGAAAWRSATVDWAGPAADRPVREYRLPVQVDVVRLVLRNGVAEEPERHGRIARATITAGSRRVTAYLPDVTDEPITLRCTLPATTRISLRVDAVYPARGRTPARSDVGLTDLGVDGSLRGDARAPRGAAGTVARIAGATRSVCDTDTRPRPRTVTVAATPAPATATAPRSYGFTAGARAGDRVYWDFGDGTRRETRGATAARHTYRRTGGETVAATVVTEAGAMATDRLRLTVGEPPTADATATP